MEEGSAIRQRLDTLPQLKEYRQRVESNDSDELCNHAEFDDAEIVSKFIKIAEEICNCDTSFLCPTSASETWAAVHCLLRDNGLAINNFDVPAFKTRKCQYKILCTLLCHALSDRCKKQHGYVGKVMSIGRSDVQQEIMRILQESAQLRNDDHDNYKTGDYSTFMEASAASLSASFEYKSDIATKRDRTDAFGDNNLNSDSPQRTKHLQVDRDDNSFEEVHNVGQHKSTDEDIL